jgi:hypothetical protein
MIKQSISSGANRVGVRGTIFTGKPCVCCGSTARYMSTRRCKQCRRAQYSRAPKQTPIDRLRQAKARMAADKLRDALELMALCG